MSHTAENDAPRCGTCGTYQEPPDEPIMAGDYWKLAAWDDPRRCPECQCIPAQPRPIPPDGTQA